MSATFFQNLSFLIHLDNFIYDIRVSAILIDKLYNAFVTSFKVVIHLIQSDNYFNKFIWKTIYALMMLKHIFLFFYSF